MTCHDYGIDLRPYDNYIDYLYNFCLPFSCTVVRSIIFSSDRTILVIFLTYIFFISVNNARERPGKTG